MLCGKGSRSGAASSSKLLERAHADPQGLVPSSCPLFFFFFFCLLLSHSALQSILKNALHNAIHVVASRRCCASAAVGVKSAGLPRCRASLPAGPLLLLLMFH